MMRLEEALAQLQAEGAALVEAEHYASIRVFRKRRIGRLFRQPVMRWERRVICRCVEGGWIILGRWQSWGTAWMMPDELSGVRPLEVRDGQN